MILTYTRNTMTTKTQLQSKIQELEAQLQEFKKQLGSYKEITIENASVRDTLEDGSIVLQKSNGLALLVAPKETEVTCKWSKGFTEVFSKLEKHGFNPSQWFVPTQEQLKIAWKLLHAYNHIDNEFLNTNYWSSTENSATNGCCVYFNSGDTSLNCKANSCFVRAFRCVTY